MFFKGLPLTIRLNHQTISFKDIITGGWALKFQAIQDLEWVLLWLDHRRRRSERDNADRHWPLTSESYSEAVWWTSLYSSRTKWAAKLLKLRKHIDCWTLDKRRQTIGQRSVMPVACTQTESNMGFFVRKKDSKKDSFS